MVIVRTKQAKIPFSPDGPLTWGEIDLVRTDVFTPALLGLLAPHPVRPGDRWTANPVAVQELTDMERIDDGRVECRMEPLTVLEGRRHARVGFSGKLRGVNEDGPNSQELDGYFFFDLESNHLSYLYLNGVHHLLDKNGKSQGKIEGRFVLTRQLQSSADLADAALRGLALEPDAERTLLLYENPEAGVRFLHPRRWRVAGAQGRQVILDEANGSGLVLTAEPPTTVPTAEQFLRESQRWLDQSKAKILRIDPPRALADAAGVERFTIDMELGGQRAIMHYYIVRQAGGGATLAARLLPADVAVCQPEVERIARSISVHLK